MSDETQPSSEALRATGPAASGDAVATAPPRAWSRWAPLFVAIATPALLFFLCPPLTKSGLWDPFELNVADLSRRIALNLYHASHLALDGADNSLPHLNDLGRPQLPMSSIAVGFKLFGLHEWAGRFPLALWGFAGVLATYAFAARLFDRRAGAYAAIALSTMPVYFVQARSMLGEVCAMAGLAMAFGGLAVAAFDRDERGPTPIGKRLPWLAMGAIGLFVGFESRGGLLGLCVPLLGVGLAWAAAWLSSTGSRSPDGSADGKRPARTTDPAGDAVGALSLLAGALIAAMAARAIAAPETKDLNLWAGAMFHAQAKYPTFDYYVAAVGHALAPWSAFLPFAFGRLLLAPPVPIGPAQGTSAAQSGPSYLAERESLARVAVVVGSAVALVAHGYLAARIDYIAFTGPALCAVACAVAIRDFERGAHASIAVGLGTLVLAAVLHHDFHELPEKAYQAFGVVGASFPESFKSTALALWWVVLGGFALCAFLTWVEQDAKRDAFDPASYGGVLRGLREAYDGVLALVYFAIAAGAVLAALFVWVGNKTHGHWLPQMSSTIRDVVLNAWWFVLFVPLGTICGLLFACDVWLWAFGESKPLSQASFTRGFEPFEALMLKLRPDDSAAATAAGAAEAPAAPLAPRPKLARYDWWVALVVLAPLMLIAIPAGTFAVWSAVGFRPYVAALLAVPSGVAFFLVMGVVGDVLRHRAACLALGGAVVGFVLCVFYYPALANQLSPKEVFESYRRFCPDAPLGLLGVGGRTAAYYAGGQPQIMTDPTSAYAWLTAGGSDERRCLALKAEELPKLNQLWREHAPEPRSNLPVLDARSSQILLVASTLGPHDKNENPLSSMVLSVPPRPQRRLDANMDDKLEVIGIDFLDDRGRLVDAVSPGRAYHMKTYYRVLAPVTTEWEGFIHIDGYHRRHNGDHKPMNGKYPMSLWLPGDLLADDHEFKLEPNFTPGTYEVYFGLFVGDTRLKVKSGPNDGDNRVNGGPLRVQ
ncbi:MAG TPA: glycosyltransferase family 39 protein [Polyangiaceae bacterium]|nr:glycosyltransferase family 39 protein [Polyangiaceae bacterium]